jgi:phosphate starvation-inducible PhoH-like protein
LVFVIGPAGTGKTYLAVAVAVQYLKSGRVSKLVLTRPAVEAGEKIGYLPGGILEKVDPFMRPIYDCLYDILDYREVSKLIERGILEVIPIAFMRGRTISDAFIIVDEAQNLTYDQVKMTLTRMGLGSKMVLTADLTQIDIQKSGLSGLDQILGGIEGIAFVYLNHQDVVRHPVVSKIIQAFERYDKMREEKEKVPKK